MALEVEKYKIAIPSELYNKIDAFISKNLAPIVYDCKSTFSACTTDEIGFYNEDGSFVVRDDDGLKKMCCAFLGKLFDIEDALDKFAMEELQPWLL